MQLRIIFYGLLCSIIFNMSCSPKKNVRKDVDNVSIMAQLQSEQDRKNEEAMAKKLDDALAKLKENEASLTSLTKDKDALTKDKETLSTSIQGSEKDKNSILAKLAELAKELDSAKKENKNNNVKQKLDLSMPVPGKVTYKNEELLLSEMIPNVSQIVIGSKKITEDKSVFDFLKKLDFSFSNDKKSLNTSLLNTFTCLINKSMGRKYDNISHEVTIFFKSTLTPYSVGGSNMRESFTEEVFTDSKISSDTKTCFDDSEADDIKFILFDNLFKTIPKITFKIKGERVVDGPGIITIQISDAQESKKVADFFYLMSVFFSDNLSSDTLFFIHDSFNRAGKLAFQFTIWAPASLARPLGQFELTANLSAASVYLASWQEADSKKDNQEIYTSKIAGSVLPTDEVSKFIFQELGYWAGMLSTVSYSPTQEGDLSQYNIESSDFAVSVGRMKDEGFISPANSGSMLTISDRLKLDGFGSSACYLTKKLAHFPGYNLKIDGTDTLVPDRLTQAILLKMEDLSSEETKPKIKSFAGVAPSAPINGTPPSEVADEEVAPKDEGSLGSSPQVADEPKEPADSEPGNTDGQRIDMTYSFSEDLAFFNVSGYFKTSDYAKATISSGRAEDFNVTWHNPLIKVSIIPHADFIKNSNYLFNPSQSYDWFFLKPIEGRNFPVDLYSDSNSINFNGILVWEGLFSLRYLGYLSFIADKIGYVAHTLTDAPFNFQVLNRKQKTPLTLYCVLNCAQIQDGEKREQSFSQPTTPVVWDPTTWTLPYSDGLIPILVDETRKNEKIQDMQDLKKGTYYYYGFDGDNTEFPRALNGNNTEFPRALRSSFLGNKIPMFKDTQGKIFSDAPSPLKLSYTHQLTNDFNYTRNPYNKAHDEEVLNLTFLKSGLSLELPFNEINLKEGTKIKGPNGEIYSASIDMSAAFIDLYPFSELSAEVCQDMVLPVLQGFNPPTIKTIPGI